MINKHTANRFMGVSKMPVTTNPLLVAQYAKKNAAVAKHQDDLQADFLIKAIRDSAKPLVTSVRSSNNTLATLLSKDVKANEDQVRYSKALVDSAERAYRDPPPALLKTLRSNTEVSRIIAKGINDNVDLMTRTQTFHVLERKEDLAYLEAEKRRDVLRNDILAKIEQFLNPRKMGLFDKLFSGMKVVGGAVVGGAALGVGKMVKAILTGQAFQLAGASVVGISRFFSDTVKFVAKPLGLTNAAGSKVYFGQLVKKLPLIGTFIKGIYSTFDALSVMADAGKAGALLDMKPEDLQVSDKVAAALGTFLKDMSWGLTDYLAKTLGFENTQRMIKAGFDKAKDLVPMIGAVADTVVNWTTNAVTASAEFIQSEVKKFQQADSTAAYLKDASKRLAETTVVVASAVGTYINTTLTSATTAVKEFFRTEDVTPDGTVLQRYMTPKEVIDKLSTIASSVATTVGQMVGGLVSSTITLASSTVDGLFKTEEVTPDGTVLKRYLTSREIADQLAGLATQVATGVITAANNALSGMFTSDAGAVADVRMPQDKLRDFIRQGFDIVSKGVNASILFAYDLAAKAIGSMFEKGDGPYTESMLSVAVKEIAFGTVKVFTSAVSTLANRLVESVTSEEFLGNARDVIHSITSSIFAPITQAAIVLNKIPVLNAAPDALAQIGRWVMSWNESIQTMTLSWRSFSKVVVGMQEMVDGATGTVTSVLRVTKNVEETFIVTKKIADFFDGIGGLMMKVGGGLKFLGNTAQFISKWAWPIQAVLSIFDFLDGFSEEVAAGRLGIDPKNLNIGDKIGSGIGSIVKGLADLPLTIINWLGRQIFGDGFNVGEGEDMAKYVAKNIHQIVQIINGEGSVGDVAAVMFKGLTGVPFAIGAAILRNVFGFEVKSLDEVGDGIKTWVNETVSKVKNINFGEVIANALAGIGDWLGSVFSVENLKKMVIGSLQRIPGGQTILEWAGVLGPEVAPTVGASQTPAAQANTMAIVKPQYQKWEQDKIKAAEKNDVATIEKLEKQQAELLKRNGLKADSQGNLSPDTSNQPAPPVYQALGGAWDHGKITKYALGGVPDIVSQPTLVPTGGGNHALIAEAGYPEGILPLQRMKDGKLGVHAVLPPWPRQIDFKNVTFNLDDNSGKGLADQLADALTKAGSSVGDMATSAAYGAKNFVNGLFPQKGPIQVPQQHMETVANTLAQMTGENPQKILSALNDAQGQANSGLSQAQVHMQKLLDSGKSVLSNVGSNPSLKPMIDSMANAVGIDPNQVHAAIGNAGIQIQQGFNTAANKVQDFVKSQQPMMGGNTPQERAQDFIKRMGDKLGAKGDSFFAAYKQAKEKNPNMSSMDVFKAIGFDQDQILGAMDGVKKDLNVKTIDEYTNGKPMTVSQSLNNAGTAATNFVANGVDAAKGAASTGIDMVNNGVKSAVSGIDQFMAKTRIAESGGKDNAVSDTGATGRYQFTKGTWNDITKNHADRLKELGIDNPRLATKNNKYNPNLNDPRYDVKAQEAYMRILTENNAKQMGTDDPGALYLAHFMGAGSAKKIVQASMNGNGSANALSLLSKESQDHLTSGGTNNSIMQGKSADQIMAWARKKMDATGTMVMNGANATGQAASNAASATGQAASNAASYVGGKAQGAWNSVSNTASEIKDKMMWDGSAAGASALLSHTYGFGQGAQDIITSIISGGDAKAASNASALKGGRGNPTESYNDFAKYTSPAAKGFGFSLMQGNDLAAKRAGMDRMGVGNPAMQRYGAPSTAQGNAQMQSPVQETASERELRRITNDLRRESGQSPLERTWGVAQMEAPKAINPTYGDKVETTAMAIRSANADIAKAGGMKNSPPSAAQNVQAPGPTNDGPSIDAIPMFINDMGLIFVNNFMV